MKKPLYLTPFLAFALLMPPALMPQAAFADSPGANPKYIVDQSPGDGVWSKITLSGADAYEAGVYYVPVHPRGTAAPGYVPCAAGPRGGTGT